MRHFTGIEIGWHGINSTKRSLFQALIFEKKIPAHGMKVEKRIFTLCTSIIKCKGLVFASLDLSTDPGLMMYLIICVRSK
jgi:hypothetical protein